MFVLKKLAIGQLTKWQNITLKKKKNAFNEFKLSDIYNIKKNIHLTRMWLYRDKKTTLYFGMRVLPG